MRDRLLNTVNQRLKTLEAQGAGLGVEIDRDKLTRYHELSKQHEMGAWTDDPRRRGAVITQPKW